MLQRPDRTTSPQNSTDSRGNFSGNDFKGGPWRRTISLASLTTLTAAGVSGWCAASVCRQALNSSTYCCTDRNMPPHFSCDAGAAKFAVLVKSYVQRVQHYSQQLPAQNGLLGSSLNCAELTGGGHAVSSNKWVVASGGHSASAQADN